MIELMNEKGRREPEERTGRYRVFYISRGRMEARPGKAFSKFESARRHAERGSGLNEFCVIQRLQDKKVVWIDYSAI